MKLLHKAFLAKGNTNSNLKLCWLICDCTCDDIPNNFDGSLNQGSSDRFSNREIRVALTKLIPVCLSTRMVYLFLSCTRFFTLSVNCFTDILDHSIVIIVMDKFEHTWNCITKTKRLESPGAEKTTNLSSKCFCSFAKTAL